MKYMIRLISFMIAVVLTLSLVMPVLAVNGEVIYVENAKEFIFAPGSEYSPTDLFSNFKDVMPGDSISQEIVVKNDISKDVKIKVYMRSLGAHEDSVDFLSKLNLHVEKLEDTVMFDAPADQTAQLTDWVYLGTLYSGGEVNLNVILDVPTSLDNENKNLIGYLDWEFMIEELPVEDTDPKPPETGDDSNLVLYAGMFICSGAILIILILYKHKKEEKSTIKSDSI